MSGSKFFLIDDVKDAVTKIKDEVDHTVPLSNPRLRRQHRLDRLMAERTEAEKRIRELRRWCVMNDIPQEHLEALDKYVSPPSGRVWA